MSKKVRDNSYWLPRLAREFPAIYARLMASDIPSVRAACAEAELIRLPTRLGALKREWERATTAEQDEFLRYVAGTASTTPAPALKHGPIADANMRLTKDGTARLEAAMVGRKFGEPRRWQIGNLMRELGRSPLDTSVGMALSKSSRLKPSPLAEIEAWLIKNGC